MKKLNLKELELKLPKIDAGRIPNIEIIVKITAIII